VTLFLPSFLWTIIFLTPRQTMIHMLFLRTFDTCCTLTIPQCQFGLAANLNLTLIRCQFHQRKTREFFVRTSFLYVRVTRKSRQNVTFVRKTRAKNVNEIDGRCQFHQHSISNFCASGFTLILMAHGVEYTV